jgi:hypothetical protein
MFEVNLAPTSYTRLYVPVMHKVVDKYVDGEIEKVQPIAIVRFFDLVKGVHIDDMMHHEVKTHPQFNERVVMMDFENLLMIGGRLHIPTAPTEHYGVLVAEYEEGQICRIQGGSEHVVKSYHVLSVLGAMPSLSLLHPESDETDVSQAPQYPIVQEVEAYVQAYLNMQKAGASPANLPVGRRPVLEEKRLRKILQLRPTDMNGKRIEIDRPLEFVISKEGGDIIVIG